MSDSTETLALRLRQAAAVLGVSPRCLWDWAKKGIVPCKKVGAGKRQVLLFSVHELRNWLAASNSTQPKGGVA